MTNDVLHASIAAALVQANLQFTTAIGTVAEEPDAAQTAPVRTFTLEFDFQGAGGKCQVTGYVAGPVLVVLSPVKIPDASRRQEIADAIVYRMPLVRVLPAPPNHPNQDIAWVEASVPIAPIAQLAAPGWLVVPPFMNVVGAVEHIVQTYREHASLPEPQPSAFLLSIDTQRTQGAQHSAA